MAELDSKASSRIPPLSPSPLDHPQGRAQRDSSLTFLLQETMPWLVLGTGFMFAGISITYSQLLPRIYVCPIDSCPHSLLPSNIPHVQALMNYWLSIGTLISGIALTKLLAYQAWLTMKWRGNTIKVIQHSLDAVQGDIYAACSLVLRTYNPSLGLLALIKIGIVAAISLVVGFSISDIDTYGQVRLEFTYPTNFTLPVLTTRSFALTTVQRTVTNRLEGWLLAGDQSHGGVTSEFQGTYVVPDNRSIFAINPQPGGPRMMSNVYCSSSNIASAVLMENTTDRYNITTTNGDAIPAAPLDRLSVLFLEIQRVPAETGGDLATLIRYFWISNTTGILSNSTISTDGKAYATQCNHTIWMADIPQMEGVQVIEPSVPFTPLSDDIPTSILTTLTTNQAVTLSLANLITLWWSTSGGFAFQSLTCLSGVFAPFGNNDEPCQVDDGIWRSTVTTILDAVVQTGVKSGNTTQQLWSRADTISRTRWWWQAVIPVSVLLAYVVFLCYTLHLNQAHEEPKELGLSEVLATLIQDKGVTESTMVGGIAEKATQDIEQHPQKKVYTVDTITDGVATLIQDKGMTESTVVGGIAEKAPQDIEQYPQEKVYRVDTIRDGVVVGDNDQS